MGKFNAPLQRISTRLLLSYSIPLVCFSILGTTSYSNARHIVDLETHIAALETAQNTGNDATYQLIDAVRKIKGYTLRPFESRHREMYVNDYNAAVESTAALSDYAMSEGDSQLQQIVTELERDSQRLHRTAEQMITMIESSNVSGATSQIANLSAVPIDQRRQDLRSYFSTQISERRTEIESAQAGLLQTILGGTALASLVSIGIGFWVVRQLRLQIQRMVGVVEHSGVQVTTSSTQIAASSRQLEATVTEQAASATEISATATEISATAEALSRTMSQVADLSEAAVVTAADGQQGLIHMEETIAQLTSATATISSKLGLIDSKANNISNVVTAITKVADQTNLLSLNAAIEAEKAGEYGAGFSVVAREIRRLADQTAIATLEIEQMVQEMLSSVSTGVMEMDRFTQDVSSNAANIGQISEQISRIIHQVQSLAPQFESVSAGVATQAESAQQICSAIAQLSDSSQQTAETVKDTNHAISLLGTVAQELQSEVVSFKVAV